MLAIKQHDGAGAPGVKFTDGSKDAGKRGVVKGQGLVLRIHNAEENETNGKNTGRIAKYEQRPFKPAAFIHSRAEVQQCDHHSKDAEQEQQDQGQGVFNNYTQID